MTPSSTQSDAQERGGPVRFPGGCTVLMAVYGGDDPGLFLRALSSVYANTSPPEALVLVVDGPVPDGIERVIERLDGQSGALVHRLPTNQGLASALNRGLDLVRTEWVARADADDENVAGRFERQAMAILESAERLDVLGGAILEVDRSGRPLAIRSAPQGHREIVRRLANRNPFNHMTVAYRASVVKAAGGYPDLHLKEDYGLWARLIAKGARCANVPDVLVHATAGVDMYRRRGGLRYCRSEWRLQFFMVALGLRSVPSAVFYASLRSVVFLLPAGWRGWVYRRILRTRPG